jgi:hypothetical protein
MNRNSKHQKPKTMRRDDESSMREQSVEELIITGTTMERLFSPCNRFQDLIENQDDFDEYFDNPGHELLQELNLDVSTEEFLSAERAFTYADLYALLGNGETVVWLSPHAAASRTDGPMSIDWEQLDDLEWCRFQCRVDGKEIVAMASSPEHLLEICDVVLRLLAVSEVHRVILEESLIDAPTLAYLMEQCQSLKTLTLSQLINPEMDEDHCRVLGAYLRPDLEIVLENCTISDTGASVLAEVLGRNQGPANIDLCSIDNLVLANGLRGNSRLKSLNLCLSENVEVHDREILAIAGALRENKGLVDLDLSNGLRVNDVMWGAICDSLKAHPTLEVLNLRGVFTVTTTTPAVLKSQIQALLDMMKTNMLIHTIKLNHQCCCHKIYRESVIPYLETNRLRPRLLAIQKTLPHAYRAKVLGRALLAVRTDPNRFWMLLSGNSEVAFPSTTATTTTAASLPTPANAVASESIAPVVATASVSATAASSVIAAAAAAAGQKRKACP